MIKARNAAPRTPDRGVVEDEDGSPRYVYLPSPPSDIPAQAESIRRLLRENTPPRAEIGRVERVDTEPERTLLERVSRLQAEQANNARDYAVRTGEEGLLRAKEDARAGFDAQRAKIRADELRELDNLALYSELRGDRGGLGLARYASAQNSAAQARAAVDREQQRLATDTARQIQDLRGKGEFEKADRLLDISQNYLSSLLQLHKWAKEKNLDVDELNSELERFEAEYALEVKKLLAGTELDAAKLSGYFADGARAR